MRAFSDYIERIDESRAPHLLPSRAGLLGPEPTLQKAFLKVLEGNKLWIWPLFRALFITAT
jgi:hypothetical protein